MVELRLHLELYSPEAIDEAVRTFEPFAAIEMVAEAPYRLVRITASSPAREKSIAGELGNFALGTTMSSRASAAEPDGSDAGERAQDTP